MSIGPFPSSGMQLAGEQSVRTVTAFCPFAQPLRFYRLGGEGASLPRSPFQKMDEAPPSNCEM